MTAIAPVAVPAALAVLRHGERLLGAALTIVPIVPSFAVITSLAVAPRLAPTLGRVGRNHVIAALPAAVSTPLARICLWLRRRRDLLRGGLFPAPAAAAPAALMSGIGHSPSLFLPALGLGLGAALITRGLNLFGRLKHPFLTTVAISAWAKFS